jgi:hypothetical protein
MPTLTLSKRSHAKTPVLSLTFCVLGVVPTIFITWASPCSTGPKIVQRSSGQGCKGQRSVSMS